MSREIISAKTIKEWQALPPATQQVILSNIRLVPRLAKWLEDMENRPKLMEPIQSVCHRCDGTGNVTHYPRLPGVHASKLGSPCNLSVYMMMEGVPEKEDRDLDNRLTLALGTAAHQMIQSYGRKGAWGPHYKDEVRISEDIQEIAHKYFLESSADADNLLIIEDVPGPIYEVGIIHEYKTIKSSNFKELRGPKDDHKVQAMLYAAALDRPVVVFMYLNKDTGSLLDYPVAFDTKVWGALEGRLALLNEYYDRHEAPPPNPSFSNCRWCSYKYCCQYAHK